MEMAFDVIGMDETYSRLIEAGAEPFCSPCRINLGFGTIAGFAYVRDPDVNMVQLIEVKKVGFLPPKVVRPLLSGMLNARAKL